MKNIIYLLFLLFLLTETYNAESVSLRLESDTPQLKYALKKLTEALIENNYDIVEENADNDFLISLQLNPDQLNSEAFSIMPDNNNISISGGDNRGLIYGALSVAEHLMNGLSLQDLKPEEGKPELEFRGIKFNLPWNTYRPSSALDQHYETVRDLNYWEAFLDMLVENRFNVISFWNMHPYTYMIRPKNYPEACKWSDEELAEWQNLFHEIFRMAKERALDTYIVHWNIFVSKEFAEANKVAKENFYPFYYVQGDTSQIVQQYMSECIKQVLEEYPNLDGIGVSHGEGMAGMTPLQRQQWVDDVIIKAMLKVDRPVKLIHRVPFSSGTSSDPGVSKTVEEVTRTAMEKMGDSFEGPIWVEIKFNWSHGHSTTKLEKVHGGKLGDTYFIPKPKNYKIVWQIRNEDFFALRWGVPDFIRKHIAANGNADYVGGYFTGSETYIPALDYFTAIDKPVDWKWAFQRQWLFYKLWGRLLYDSNTPDEVFQNEFIRRYDSKGNNLLRAFSLASNTQLQLASLYDSKWDFTLYSEGLLALQGDSTKYISVNQLIEQPTMSSAYISIKDYVDAELEGKSYNDEMITPNVLADILEKDNLEALRLVENIDVSGNTSLMYEIADIKIWAYLGLHLSEKIRGAIALQKFRLKGILKNEAIKHLQKALDYWDQVIDISRPIYKDMRLTHYNHNYFTANNENYFHWALIRREVAKDLEIVLNEKQKNGN